MLKYRRSGDSFINPATIKKNKAVEYLPYRETPLDRGQGQVIVNESARRESPQTI